MNVHRGNNDEELNPFVVVRTGREMDVTEFTVGTPLRIGRNPSSDIVLDGPTAENDHATLLWNGETFILTTLVSHGVHIGGKPADAVQAVEPGEDIAIAGAQLVVGIPSALNAVGRRTLTHQEFRERVYEELARAGRQSRPTALVMVQTRHGDGQAVAERALDQFRAGDVVGIYAPNVLEFLLPDTVLTNARSVIQRVVERFPDVVVGMAVAPLDADQPERLLWTARAALENAVREDANGTPEAGTSLDDLEPVALSQATRTLHEAIAEAPKGGEWLLLTGEVSTGKGLAARLIHETGPNATGPFVTIYCSELIDDERIQLALGATSDQTSDGAEVGEGRIDAARGGTLLLDELGELPREYHDVMRRALLARKGTMRVVATTQRAIAGLVGRGAFDAELYGLFADATVELPPLRTRTADILPLATQFAMEAGSNSPVNWSPGAIARLRSYPWPGNVLELKNAMYRAVQLTGGGELLAEHLPSEPMPIASNRGRLREHVDGMERDAIIRTLADCNHNQTHAAKALGISRRALIYKMEKFGLKPPPKSMRRTR